MKQIFFALLLFLICSTAVVNAADGLSTQIESLLFRPIYAETQWGVFIYSLTYDSVIYSCNAERLFVPASTMKLFTSAAALDSLGPDYRFETAFLADGALDSAGTLWGDLIVRGSGDPTFRNHNGSNGAPTPFQQIADSLWQHGLRKIQGRIVGDARAWPRELPCPSWQIGDLQEDWAPITGALSLNRNDQIGDSSLFSVMETHANSSAVFVPSPTFSFLVDFQRALRNDGIWISQNTDEKLRAHATATMYVHESAPLSEILKQMNKKSDNFCAEQLALVLGQGSREQGLEVVSQFLTRAGMDTLQMRLADASGISRENLLSPAMIVQLLRYMHTHRFANEYKESLAVMGMDGTLGSRFVGAPGVEVRAKTGTLDYVSALSGYMKTEAGEEIAFSFLCNNFLVSNQTIQQVQDSLCRLVAKER
jgi:D-alanyl-D-alanine carboxypeptidase/D-alanyl-D-alanine-endopeptidase (penicillin-binding protein 4)